MKLDPASLQRRIARVAIAPSTLRGQGRRGCVSAAREYLAEIDISRFSPGGRRAFARVLDETTEELRLAFPSGARSWGFARKSLNIFLRDVLYNKYLSRQYRLGGVSAQLEVPLDGIVGKKICSQPEGTGLRWRTIKDLKSEENSQFQLAAAAIAKRHGVDRVHLDLLFWSGTR